MIRIAICDDNDLQRELELDMLHDFFSTASREAEIVSFANGEELITTVKNDSPFDIYVLDMIMPGMNGMEVAATLRYLKDAGIIIFLTSTLEYAAASYDVKAFYYMLKPVDPDRFRKVMNNALENVENTASNVLIRCKGGDIRVRTHEITYVELVSRVPTYHLNDGRVVAAVIPRGSFSEEMSRLIEDKNFVQCGVGLVINLKYVDAVDSESILLRDGTQLYPARSAFQNFKRVWKPTR